MNKTKRICKAVGCNKHFHAKGYCYAHYIQIWKGEKIRHFRNAPNEREIIGDIAYITLYDFYHDPLSEKVLIDAEDIEKINGCRITRDSPQKGCSISIKVHSKNIRLHRFLMNPPSGMVVDHINHNRLDNRKSNLRICTQQQNTFNRFSEGMSYSKDYKNWFVQIAKGGKRYNLGSFANKEDALKARVDAEKYLFGEFALARN